MDVFIEQIVKKNLTTRDKLLKVGVVLAVIILASIFFFVSTIIGLGAIGPALAFVCAYLGYVFISGLNVEYEYIVTNGEIDIDKISAKRKRKRLVSIRVSSFEKFGDLKTALPVNGITIINASSGLGEGDYFAEFNHSKLGHARLIFSPNQKVLDGMKPFIPRTIRQTNI